MLDELNEVALSPDTDNSGEIEDDEDAQRGVDFSVR